MTAGRCKGCGNRSADSDICDKCMDRMDHLEEHPRRRFNPAPSSVRIPYDPNDPF